MKQLGIAQLCDFIAEFFCCFWIGGNNSSEFLANHASDGQRYGI
jgi:hypothetical protein